MTVELGEPRPLDDLYGLIASKMTQRNELGEEYARLGESLNELERELRTLQDELKRRNWADIYERVPRLDAR